MNKEVITGTSNNVIHDLRRLDREYLVQIMHWFWIVRLTDEQREALSIRLQQLVVSKHITATEGDSDSLWAITCLDSIRDRREPFSIDEFLADSVSGEGEPHGN